MDPTKLKQNLRVFWKLMNLRDCVWEIQYRIIMKTTLQEKKSFHYIIIIWFTKFIPMPQAMKIPEAKAASDKDWEKMEKISAWKLTKVRSKKEVIDEARTKGAKVHFASLMDICHLKIAELEAKLPKLQRSSSTPRWYCKRRFWVLRSIHWTRFISITNDSSKSHVYYLQIAWLRGTSSWRSICLYPSKNGGCSQKFF